MKRGLDLLVGFFSALVAAWIGCVLFVCAFTSFDPWDDYFLIVQSGSAPKILVLGSLLSLLLFWIFVVKKQDFKARGVIFAIIFLALLTQFI